MDVSHRAEDEITMRRYLLGQLSETEQSQAEERFFAEATYFEHLSVLEEELIDEYVRDKMSLTERQQFETHFLSSPRRREQLRFAQAFRESLAPPLKAQSEARGLLLFRSWWSAIQAWWQQNPAAGLVLVAASLLLALSSVGLVSLRTQLGREQSERAQLRRQLEQLQQRPPVPPRSVQEQQLAAQLAQEQSERRRLEQELAQGRFRPPARLSFVLTAGLLRDAAEPKRFLIPGDSGTVRLHLELDAEQRYPRYQAVLRSVDGNEVWSQSELSVRQHGARGRVLLTLPARLLRPGEYLVLLSGISNTGQRHEVADYSFQVTRP